MFSKYLQNIAFFSKRFDFSPEHSFKIDVNAEIFVNWYEINTIESI